MIVDPDKIAILLKAARHGVGVEEAKKRVLYAMVLEQLSAEIDFEIRDIRVATEIQAAVTKLTGNQANE